MCGSVGWGPSALLCPGAYYAVKTALGDHGTVEVIISILPLGTLGSVASLLAATLYQGNHDRNHSLWNLGSTEIYISTFSPFLYMQDCD